MKTFKIKFTVLKMGRQCASCRQNIEGEYQGETPEQALANAKHQSGANPETHKFMVNYIREIS